MTSVPKTMQGVVYYNNSDVRLEEMPVPEINSREVLVKMEACGLCGSELTEYYMIPRSPLVMGHEPTGTIAKVGKEVTWLKEGDRVFAHHHVGCLSCHECNRGHYTLCENFRKDRLVPGGLAEYFKVPELNTRFDTLILPDNISFELGTLIEPLGCTLRGLKLTPINYGDTVVIIGMGFIGLCYLALVKLSGAGKIIVTDLNDWRLEQGLKQGATHTINSGKEDPIERLMEINNGKGADAIFVAVPNINVWDQALAMCRKGATMSFGTPLNPNLNWSLNPFDLWETEVKMNYTYSTSHLETAAILDLIASGRLDVEDLITHRFGLDEVPKAINLYKQAGESIKQIILPNMS